MIRNTFNHIRIMSKKPQSAEQSLFEIATDLGNLLSEFEGEVTDNCVGTNIETIARNSGRIATALELLTQHFLSNEQIKAFAQTVDKSIVRLKNRPEDAVWTEHDDFRILPEIDVCSDYWLLPKENK